MNVCSPVQVGDSSQRRGGDGGRLRQSRLSRIRRASARGHVGQGGRGQAGQVQRRLLRHEQLQVCVLCETSEMQLTSYCETNSGAFPVVILLYHSVYLTQDLADDLLRSVDLWVRGNLALFCCAAASISPLRLARYFTHFLTHKYPAQSGSVYIEYIQWCYGVTIWKNPIYSNAFSYTFLYQI